STEPQDGAFAAPQVALAVQPEPGSGTVRDLERRDRVASEHRGPSGEVQPRAAPGRGARKGGGGHAEHAECRHDGRRSRAFAACPTLHLSQRTISARPNVNILRSRTA